MSFMLNGDNNKDRHQIWTLRGKSVIKI